MDRENNTAASLRPDVILLRPYPGKDTDRLREEYMLHCLWEAEDRDALLAACAPRVRAIATDGETGAPRALIQCLPKLEIIACYGVGYDAIDLDTARSRGIRVTNTPDVLTNDVADQGVALMLALCRGIPAGDRHVRDGRWPDGPLPLATRFYGKKLGICGFGRIGRTMARRVTGFDMEVGYFDLQAVPDSPARFFRDLEEMAAWCDILIVSLLGGETTRNTINSSVLRALGSHGLLVNISRGSTVDEEALLTALETDAIAGAALDVFQNEPNINPRFLALANVVLQPHRASATVETRAAMGQLVRDNLAAHFSGKALLTPVV